MEILWVILCVALEGLRSGFGLPLGMNGYPQDDEIPLPPITQWESVVFITVPTVVSISGFVIIVLGCVWCYNHRDCKLFSSSCSSQPENGSGSRYQPDSGFSEPSNNNISEDNNNGPISLREMQNIANNNAAAYIVSENEERNRTASRESVVRFEPLPGRLGPPEPLVPYIDWFEREEFPRARLQYLREIGRGWFGRIVHGEVDNGDASTSSVAVKILNQDATAEDKARFLSEARLYRDTVHDHVLALMATCLREDPWILMFDLYQMTLQQYLVENRPKMAALNASGAPLRLITDVADALTHLHSMGFTYGSLNTSTVFIRGSDVSARAVLGRYADVDGEQHNHWSTDVYNFGLVVWAVMWWGAPPAPAPAPAPTPASSAAPCPYPEHLYRVTQLCTDPEPSNRPEASRLLALVTQLVAAHRPSAPHDPLDPLLAGDFEARWQRLQPNCASAPPSPPTPTTPTTLRTESLTNLHGSLEDVRALYLTRDDLPSHRRDLDLSTGHPDLEQDPPCPRDLSDDTVDPWLKDIVAGSLDDVSYYRDVSDVIKNLDNILNSEKTSSSESSHQASPSRDNLSLDCKREPPVQSCLVKSPGIGNFQNVLEMDGEREQATCVDEDIERDAVGSLSHSFERHSDSTSQSTLENLTPETPSKNIESICEEPDLNDAKRTCNVEMPKVNVEIVVPKLKDLCLAIRPSLSDEQPEEDCTAPCDRSDNSVLTKSVSENVPQDNEMNNIDLIKEFIRNESVVVLERTPKKIAIEKTPSETNSTHNESETNKKSPEEISDVITTSERVVDSIIAEAKRSLSLKMKEDIAPLDILQMRDDDTLSLKNGLHKEYMPEILPTSLTAVVLEQYELKDKLAREEKSAHDSAISERADAEDTSAQISFNTETLKVNDEVTDKSISESFERSLDTASTMPIGNIPEDVQNANENEEKMADESDHTLTENLDKLCNLPQAVNTHNDSTVYMDLINTTASEIKKNDTMNENVKNVITNCFNADNINDSHEYTIVRNDSTVYMELPALIQDTQNFIHLERLHNDMQVAFDDIMTASTPKNDNEEAKAAQSVTRNEVKSGRITPDYGPGVTLTKLEQKCVADYMSPCDSPTKSHPTDTYDENSSVVLGSFENCSLELFKGIKSEMDIPKEEFLAFSSNFTEMNLETPSPLRDGNFLNEVPDIEVEDSKSVEISKDSLENTATEKVKSPSTPPNSPGIFLASTSKHKYVVDIDLSSPNEVALNAGPSVQEAIDLHQIELQMASKLAMAENENNMNIEYSGPLVEEPEDEPESYLAGNGGLNDEREDLGLDEDCMKALRNELELKLPLAQVASIEPTEEAECSEPVAQACWAPELVAYPGALSPIAEETLRQLSAYDNDVAYVPSTRTTDSSESYLEPCNNSTDDVTELTANPASNATYTLDHVSVCDTYTLHKDANTSREITMSADSLNGSPSHAAHAKSPDDATYNKQDREPTLERISQVSPLLLSPTTDTSAPETTDNATCVYTLSKTTPPTDAKSSKPSDTQCLSKATSIDSWCSNDTLFNVEDNFDDLAGDADPLAAAFHDDDEPSDSTHTLTHHDDDDKDDSHCSTYIVHDDHSERADTFTPDSITANGTYTKLKTENKTSPLVLFTKSDADSSEVNSQAKDQAYGTLTTGLATHSSCTTDLFSIKDDIWRLPQPELVRRSPIADGAMNLTPPTSVDIEAHKEDSPQLNAQHSLKKMDSVEITCLRDDSHEDSRVEAPIEVDNEMNDSPNYHMRNMACSVQSTPLLESAADEDAEHVPLILPSLDTHTPDNTHMNVPNFQTFMHSAELRPQDMSSMSIAETTDLLLEGESKTSNAKDSLGSPNYTSFEESAVFKPQDIHSRSSQSEMSAVSSNEEFRMFENSVRGRPQDLSDPENASSLLLKSEGTSTMFLTNSGVAESDANNQISNTLNTALRTDSVTFSPDDSPRVPDLSNVPEMPGTSTFLDEDEEQPHSIIITHNLYKENANHTFDSHENETEMNHTYDSHTMRELKNSGSVDDSNKTQSSPENKRDSTCDTSSTNHTNEDDTKKSPATTTEQNHIVTEDKVNGVSHNYATVNYISENFEELTESNVDTNSYKDSEIELKDGESSQIVDNNHHEVQKELISQVDKRDEELKALPAQNGEVSGKIENEHLLTNGNGDHVGKMSTATEDFLLNEKKYCQLNAYLPILGDIRFTGPTSEIMSTSFTQDSPTEDTPPNGDSQSPTSASKKQNGAAAEILKEWDSDSGSEDSNSSSGEFIWKDGDGLETAVVPSKHFDHQREGGGGGGASDVPTSRRGDSSGASDASGATDGSGSEGDEVAFVPSSWDCRAEPAKTSLRSAHRDLPAESKKRVVFKRQKYHCVYEYPREAADVEPAPHLYSYSSYEYEPELAEAAELSYSQLYGHPLDMFQLRSGVSFSTDYDDDFFISSSARPFESLGTMSSQFFPGHALKSGGALEAEPEDTPDEFPPPPSPLLTELALAHGKSPSLDFTTPDSGVEDVTPGSLAEESKPPPEAEAAWGAGDSTSSSASGSPAAPAPSPSPSPGAGPDALGGLRHTRDRLKLDLPASPCLPSPSPRHARVFTFVLEKPRGRGAGGGGAGGAGTPLVMTDDTPHERAAPLLIPEEDRFAPDPPTFSTFGKGALSSASPDQPATAVAVPAVAGETAAAAEGVKGEGTVLDSGDEDSGIESSAKASLDRNANVS